MTKFEKNLTFGPFRLARLYAIYAICSRWHSGQSSTGYRLLCRAGKLMKSLGIDRPLDQIKLDRLEFKRDFYHWYRIMWPQRHEL